MVYYVFSPSSQDDVHMVCQLVLLTINSIIWLQLSQNCLFAVNVLPIDNLSHICSWTDFKEKARLESYCWLSLCCRVKWLLGKQLKTIGITIWSPERLQI